MKKMVGAEEKLRSLKAEVETEECAIEILQMQKMDLQDRAQSIEKEQRQMNEAAAAKRRKEISAMKAQIQHLEAFLETAKDDTKS